MTVSRAFILGRSSRIVPTPSATSSRTNSPTPHAPRSVSVLIGLMPAREPNGSRRGPVRTRRPVTARRLPGRNEAGQAGWSIVTTTVWPGTHERLGATVTGAGTTFAVWSPEAQWRRRLPVRRRRPRDPAGAAGAHAGGVARDGAGGGCRAAVRAAGRRAVRAGPRAAVQPAPAAAGPVRARRHRQVRPERPGLRPAGAGLGLRLRAVRAEGGRGRRRVRLGRRRATAHAVGGQRGLRGARARAHHAPPRGPRAAARHLRRAGAPGGRGRAGAAGRDRGRAAAGAAVRHRADRVPARAGQLLGLQHARVLRAARRVLVRGRHRRAGRGVQAPGPDAARGRDRGAAGRRLQPHGRGAARRTDALTARAR